MIRHRNIQKVAVEMFNVKQKITAKLLKDSYNLGNDHEFRT